MSFTDFINSFIALLVIANPLSALPAVLGLTHRQTLAEKRQTGLIAAVSVGVILLVTTWIGMPLLVAFGIKLPAFKIAGGAVLLIMAFSMLNAEESPMKQNPSEQQEKRTSSGAVVPLAIPIIAGPGAISTIIVSVNQHPGLLNQIILSFSAILVAFTMGLLLYFASNLERIFGRSGINIFNRIGGLLLAAIAVQEIANGILALFPGLA